MGIKKVMLIAFVLLAILTLGAVSASEEADFNETLTVDDVQETIDVSLDDDGISEDGEGVLASSESDVVGDGEENLILDIDTNREFSTIEDLDEIFAAVTVPESMDGNVTISIDGNVLYNKAISDFDGGHTDGITYLIPLGGDDGNFLFDGYGQDDMIFFSFLDENENSVTRVYFINLEDNTIRFDNDDSDSPDNYETFEGLSVFIMDMRIDEPFSVIKVSEWPEGIDDYFDISLQKDGEEPIITSWDLNSVDRDRAEYAMFNIEQLEIPSDGDYFISFIFTVEGVEKVISTRYVNIAPEDNSVHIDVNNDFDVNDENHFAWIHLPSEIREGTVIVTGGEYNLFESSVDLEEGSPWWEEGDGLVCGIAPKDIDWSKLQNGDILAISFINEADETLASREFEVTIDGDNAHLEECISEDNFNWWISTHECKDEGESYISEVWFHDVNEGVLILSIENSDGDIQTYERSVEGTDNVHWELKDLGIIGETGTYTVNLTYSKDGRDLALEENHIFKLTKLQYNICENVYIANPFDVIRFYSDENNQGEPKYNVKVYVGDDEKQFSGINPYRWNLEDLGINSADSYDMTIEVYEGDDLIEEFSYTLNVDDNLDNVILYSSDLGVETWEMDGPVLYVVYPEGMDEHFKMKLYCDDKYLDEFDVESSMSWTLEDLGIEHDGGYNVVLYDDNGEWITDTWINVWCIDQFKFRTWIWDEEEDGPLYNDIEDKIISVETPEGKQGNIIIIINGDEIINWEIHEGYNEWTLEDLEMTEVNEYEITVKYLGDEEEEILAETTLNVIEYDYSTFRAILDKENEILKVYCADDGTICITVLRYDDEDESTKVYEDEYVIGAGDLSNWKEWNLEDLGFEYDNKYYEFQVSVLNDEDKEVYSYSKGYQVGIPEVEPWDDENTLYNDYEGTVVKVNVPDSAKAGILYLIKEGDIKFTTKVFPESSYEWNLKTLDINSGGDYDITLIYFDGKNNFTLSEETLKVTEFNNDTFRSKFMIIEDDFYFSFFCSEDDDGIITVIVYGWDSDEEQLIVIERNYTIDDTFKNKWTTIDYGMDRYYFEGGFHHVEVKLNGEDKIVEYSMDMMERVGISAYGIDKYIDNSIILPHGDFLWIELPFGRSIENCTVNITYGDYVFFKELSELGLYEWAGGYRYSVSFDDLDSFETLSDTDTVLVTFIHNNGKMTNRRCIEKTGDELIIHTLDDQWEGIRIDLFHEEEDEDEEEDEGPDEFETFAEIYVPVEMKITDAEIRVSSGDKIIFSKKISELSSTFDYDSASYRYYVFISDLNLTGLADKDIVNVAFISDDKILKEESALYRFDGENGSFHHYAEDLLFEVHYGPLDDPEYGMGNHDGTFIILTIPDMLNITEGTIEITLDDGTVLFAKSLSSFNDTSDNRFKIEYDDEYYQGWSYIIMANETIYSNFPQNQNMTFTFKYGENSISRKGVRVDDNLVKIITPLDVLEEFVIVISEDVLVNGTDYAITIDGTSANRQSIYIELGGGYFSVYVNGVRIDDLGRINRYDGETELYLTRLCSNNEGTQHLTIYLSDIGITENGVYDIKVTHTPEPDDDNKVYAETEVLSTNVTLTSNVKTNYENESVEWLTGYGVDPILMYLDTYYGDINATTGKITVLNSDNVTILEKNIKDLTYENGRYTLRYSDFENKNFGDNITVKYSDGNERNGTTTLDVKWRDVTPEDFNVTVVDDLGNYYGNFVNMNIPAVITTGQIIVTVKFKNNHNSSISNMNVSTDFDSHAVYTFNVADIHANYENGNFALSLSDLEFYEIDGDYDVDVKFTGDGESILPVSDETFDVSLLHAIIITINQSSRYGMEMPFASVQIFEPMNAYAELYVDGERYDRKAFEKGVATFNSFASWTPGMHTAEVRVIDNEFKSLLNSSAMEFEVKTQTGGAEASIDGTFNDDDHVILSFTAPVEGVVWAIMEDGTKKVFNVHQGDNQLDLGILPFGNHTIWVLYNETLDDGSIAYFNDYLNVFVGSWMVLPDPLVLNEEDTIKFKFGEDAEGSVRIIIDNGLLDITIPLVNGTAEFKLDESLFDKDPEHKYGTHTYDITYSGDATHESLSRSGEFEVQYLFRDNIVKDGMPLRQYYDIVVTLPGDAKGTVTMTINGKTSTAAVEDGQAKFRVEGLDMGEYPVTLSYSGDDRYPASGYENLLNVSYYGVVCDIVDGKRIVSLTLPANATGNLVIYNDNRGTKLLFSKALENGYAEIDLSGLTIGVYELRAVYDGDDYTSRKFTDKFNIYPKVNITQGAVVDEDITILVDLDNSTGYLFMVIDGKHPVLEEIVDGKVSHIESTLGYIKGIHNVTFQYFGDSFDESLFNGYVETFNLLPKPITYSVRGTDNGELIITVPEDMTGTLTVYQGEDKILEIDAEIEEGDYVIDGYGVSVTIRDGTKTIVVDVSKLLDENDPSKSKRQFTVESDSDTYVDFTADAVVGKKKPVIVGGNLNMVYSSAKKYSVTVYGSNGKAAKGEKVTFLINNKAYGVAYTNANGVASIVISKNPGTYKITAKALGVSITKKLTVTHILTLKKVKVKKSAKKLVLTATLKKLNGKYLKGKKITFKFNGKKFTAKTNKKGIAKVTVKKAVLKKLKVGKKVKYQATYLKDTVQKSVKVKK